MNIYVDKLPDCCAWCVCNDDDYRCNATGEVFDYTWGDGRLESCPLRSATDLVEVVRCADCKWFQPINNGDHGYCGTPFHGATVYEDDYCSDGERADT